jgi:hypothetical protein
MSIPCLPKAIILKAYYPTKFLHTPRCTHLKKCMYAPTMCIPRLPNATTVDLVILVHWPFAHTSLHTPEKVHVSPYHGHTMPTYGNHSEHSHLPNWPFAHTSLHTPEKVHISPYHVHTMSTYGNHSDLVILVHWPFAHTSLHTPEKVHVSPYHVHIMSTYDNHSELSHLGTLTLCTHLVAHTWKSACSLPCTYHVYLWQPQWT